METKKYIYWQDDDMWLGYLEEYPDYSTQGDTTEELEENLRDIYNELTSGSIPAIGIFPIPGPDRSVKFGCNSREDT